MRRLIYSAVLLGVGSAAAFGQAPRASRDSLAKAAAVSQGPRVTRDSMMKIEKAFDTRVAKIATDVPFDLLGATRGVYLDGYGAVFTAELNLMITAPLSPFRQTVTKDEVAKLHAKKLQRVDVLKQNMRDMLAAIASSLDTLAPNDQIVLGVTLFYYNWEDKTGLPGQIVMQGTRQKLLSGAAAMADIKIQEL